MEEEGEEDLCCEYTFNIIRISFDKFQKISKYC